MISRPGAMSNSQREDRTRLEGFEVEIFTLVAAEATSEQWIEWLRAHLEHAATMGNMYLCMRLVDAVARAGWRGCRGAAAGLELEVFKLVAAEATSEQWSKWLRAPLEHAAAKGNMDLFTRLMDAGADCRAGWRGCRGRTLLGAAAYGNEEEMVLTLLEAGSKPDVDVKFGANWETALHVAAALGSKTSCTSLMLAGADPNLLDISKYSPLHLAALAGHDEIVDRLLLRGAHTDTKSAKSKLTPLHVAAFKGHALCVSALIRGGAEKNPLSSMGETPLHLAARGNKVEAAHRLLAAGATIDILATNRWRPLDVAARHGHADVLRVLLRHGGDSKACHSDGVTALHVAAGVDGPGRDNGGVVCALVGAGADVEAKDRVFGETPLHRAADHRVESEGTIQALLKVGANVNARDAFGNTPLHNACARSCAGAVELLLCSGANEELTNGDASMAGDMVDGTDSSDDSDEDFDEGFYWCDCFDEYCDHECSWCEQRSEQPHEQRDEERELPGEKVHRMLEIKRLLRRVIGLEAHHVFSVVVSFEREEDHRCDGSNFMVHKWRPQQISHN